MSGQTVARWTGEGNDGLWSNKKNWSDNTVPDQTKYAIVEGEVEVHIDLEAVSYQLLVHEKATLTIDKDFSLTIDGSMVNNNFELVGIRTSGTLVVHGSLIINNVIGNGIKVHDSATLKAQDCDELRMQDVTGIGLRNDGEAILGVTSMFFISNAAILNFGTLKIKKELVIEDLVFNLAWGIDNYGELENSSSGIINILGQLGGSTTIINQNVGTFDNHGAINISDMETIAIHNIGVFNNYKDIIIEDISRYAIVNGGIWNNEPSSTITVNDATAPTNPALFNLGGVFNNDGEIRMTDIQYIALRNDGTFNNNELLYIDSTRTSSAIRNHGVINNTDQIVLSHINYSNGSYPPALLNEETGIINNSRSITFSNLSAHGIRNQGTIHSIANNASISMFYTRGDLYINDDGAVFEVRELHFSSIF